MKTFWLVILAALAPGCVLTNPTDPYGGMGRGPRSYLGGGPRSSATQPVQGPLTLGEAIRVALTNNPEVAAATIESKTPVPAVGLSRATSRRSCRPFRIF